MSKLSLRSSKPSINENWTFLGKEFKQKQVVLQKKCKSAETY